MVHSNKPSLCVYLDILGNVHTAKNGVMGNEFSFLYMNIGYFITNKKTSYVFHS